MCDSADTVGELVAVILCIIFGIGLAVIMSNESIMFIVGMTVGVLLLSLVIVLTGSNYYNGYEQAYRDSKKGTIEEKIKKRFPDVWIEYNAPLKGEEKPHGR